MAERQDRPTRNVITISLQYGSDGFEVARQLAARLQWQLVDEEITCQVAQRMDLTDAETALYNERAFSLFDRFLFIMRYTSPQGAEAWASGSDIYCLSLREQELFYRDTQHEIVETIASGQGKIIIGHAAQAILAGQASVFHLRVVAPLAQRVCTVMRKERLNEKEALTRIRRKDRQLAHYLRAHYRCEVDDPQWYDLVLNGRALDMESQLDLLCQVLAAPETTGQPAPGGQRFLSVPSARGR